MLVNGEGYAVCCLGSGMQGSEKCVNIAHAHIGMQAPLFGFGPAHPRNKLNLTAVKAEESVQFSSH